MPTVKLLSPTGSLEVRGTDSYGNGAYLAARSTGNVQRQHLGVDLLCKPGQLIVAPCAGKITRIGYAYPGDLRYESIHLQPDEWPAVDIKMLYVAPVNIIEGDFVTCGEVLGRSQDLGEKYPGITQHCHVEIIIEGYHQDPMSYLTLTSGKDFTA